MWFSDCGFIDMSAVRKPQCMMGKGVQCRVRSFVSLYLCVFSRCSNYYHLQFLFLVLFFTDEIFTPGYGPHSWSICVGSDRLGSVSVDGVFMAHRCSDISLIQDGELGLLCLLI